MYVHKNFSHVITIVTYYYIFDTANILQVTIIKVGVFILHTIFLLTCF